MAQKGKHRSARGWCQLQKALSAITLSQSGVTTPCENVEEFCLLLCHMSRIQPDFCVAASSNPAEDGDIPVSAVSELRPTPASFPWLSVDLQGVAYIFPWRMSIGQSQCFAEADNGVWKDLHYLLCCLEAGAPFLPGLQTALGTACSQPHPPSSASQIRLSK